MANERKPCAHCKETAEARGLPCLQACARCKRVLYCGRDCQKADYKSHKKICPKPVEHSNPYSAPRLHDLERHVSDPFTRLDKGTYLHDRPENDTFKLLTDSFRIRQADDFDYENKTTPPSIYTGAASSTEPFRQYLNRATACKGLLPPWWTSEKIEECVVFGESGAWSDIRKKVTKQGVIQHYGYDKMPLQLRLLAEVVYGVGTMGQNGTNVRKMMRQMESGGLPNGQTMSVIDVSQKR
jgi:splicing suppressor protein 51